MDSFKTAFEIDEGEGAACHIVSVAGILAYFNFHHESKTLDRYLQKIADSRHCNE